MGVEPLRDAVAREDFDVVGARHQALNIESITGIGETGSELCSDAGPRQAQLGRSEENSGRPGAGIPRGINVNGVDARSRAWAPVNRPAKDGEVQTYDAVWRGRRDGQHGVGTKDGI